MIIFFCPEDNSLSSSRTLRPVDAELDGAEDWQAPSAFVKSAECNCKTHLHASSKEYTIQIQRKEACKCVLQLHSADFKNADGAYQP